jgi:ABC-type multidrug transport system ATPase subunit
MVKDILRDQRQKGKTIVMCTHQMHQWEELCDRLVLIDHDRLFCMAISTTSAADIQAGYPRFCHHAGCLRI